jgi:cytoskeletal protein CcmA (bactofilin family)
MQITGALRSRGPVQIDGILNGDVIAPSITIGQTGTVIGSLIGAEIFIFGTVHGVIEGGAVTVNRTARIHAQLGHDSLTVEDGAVLDIRPAPDPAAEI